MNAPYDGERDREAEPGQVPVAPAPPPAQQQDPRYAYGQDPYGQDGHGQSAHGQGSHGQASHGQGQYADPYGTQGPAQDPYAQDPYAQDPYAQAQYQQSQYQQSQYQQSQYAQPQYAYDPYAQDPYLQQTYGGGVYRIQTPPGPDPVAAAYYDRAAHPPPSQQDPYAGQDGYGGGPYADPRQDGRQNPAQDPRQGGYGGQYADGQQQAAYPETRQPNTRQPGTQQPGAQQPHGRHPGRQQHPPAPDPRVWAPPPQQDAPGPGSAYLPYGDRETSSYVGVDEFMTHAYEDPQEDAYAHLFRDQRAPYPYPSQAPPANETTGRIPRTSPDGTGQTTTVTPPPAPASGRGGNILKSSALMAAGTLVSRVTGFVRTLVIAAAIGLSTLGDVYQVAMVLPTMIYILTIGGGLNSVFVPQLVRAMKEDDDGGEAYANRLLTLVMVILAVIVGVTVLAAPLLIRMMSNDVADDPVKLHVAVTFAQFCLPTIFFMGVHVVMGQILNARGRFGAMMWTPVLNNVVVIFAFGAFIWVFGSFSTTNLGADTISPQGVRLLGVGTLLGLVVQALAMIPYLRDAGFRFRPRFDWRGHGLGKAAKLAKWTFLFVLANQAGLIAVTQLATLAGSKSASHGYQGTGITAYNNALLIWQMPQAIITVSVMAAVLPRISRAAADGDPHAVRDDISYGLRTSAVAIVPAAFAFLALGVPMATLMYSSAGETGARSIGFILMAFGLGLIPFSVQYVVLRGFYAYEDTRTPFYNTVVVAAANAALAGICYLVLPSRWAVAGMAASYGLSYAIGVGVAAKRLRDRLGGDLDGARIVRTYARLVGACLPSAVIAGILVYLVTHALGSGVPGSLAALLVGGAALLGLFFVIGKRMRIEEMTALVGMVRGKLGR
jgi:putative peptidoglycan lipid II flippase